mmetsp:Transcript_20412/g.78261  ORF Transcript_20412/g.78261 Transcript_20412/m.78261 type:complete len:246 (-) Transcript_20412:1990-2727(-)
MYCNTSGSRPLKYQSGLAESVAVCWEAREAHSGSVKRPPCTSWKTRLSTSLMTIAKAGCELRSTAVHVQKSRSCSSTSRASCRCGMATCSVFTVSTTAPRSSGTARAGFCAAAAPAAWMARATDLSSITWRLPSVESSSRSSKRVTPGTSPLLPSTVQATCLAISATWGSGCREAQPRAAKHQLRLTPARPRTAKQPWRTATTSTPSSVAGCACTACGRELGLDMTDSFSYLAQVQRRSLQGNET